MLNQQEELPQEQVLETLMLLAETQYQQVLVTLNQLMAQQLAQESLLQLHKVETQLQLE